VTETWLITLWSSLGGGVTAIVVILLVRLRTNRNSKRLDMHDSQSIAQMKLIAELERRIVDLVSQGREGLREQLKGIERVSQLTQELLTLREKLGRLESSTKSAMAIVTCGADGIIQSWNQGAALMFHWTQEEAVGKEITIITPERFKARHWQGFQALVDSKRQPVPLKTMTVPALTREGIEIQATLRLSGWENGGIWTYAAEISRA
jgi:PAS domain S-box-containing protein